MHSIILYPSLILCGFSILGAFILFFAYCFYFENLRKSAFSIIFCATLLSTLCGIQLLHLNSFLEPSDLFDKLTYKLLLAMVPPLFFIFSRVTLFPEEHVHARLSLHFVPVVFVFFIRYEIIMPLIFVIGTGYSIWLANMVHRFRARSQRYRSEMFFFGLFALLAVLVLILGLSIPYMDNRIFFIIYNAAIALALVFIISALLIFPELVNDISETIATGYAQSTLGNVDINDAIGRLQELMNNGKFFQNENLNLTTLAEAMSLSSHQLSELINVHFGVGFSRYIRERRIEEAKRLLREQPEASILAISMETGFQSQSNFYAAFKEITGMSPGHYRKSAKHS